VLGEMLHLPSRGIVGVWIIGYAGHFEGGGFFFPKQRMIAIKCLTYHSRRGALLK
jgi:hypothetical protein